ncbi:hypothetical protein L195_g015185 [Trifolium pratense]|uniref:Uncharacterized protein n=1 Tax=Trifolium pratense TaxID=57577 RepID=A0A2K3MMR5_TRIPR|nr:hypothetical protein L195_g015185 [Trifolium pratense]
MRSFYSRSSRSSFPSYRIQGGLLIFSTPPLLFRRHPPQINYPPRSVPPPPEFSVRRLGILRRKSGLSGLVVHRWYSASSRRIQFHRVHVGDSGAVVTPFVQVATYATRNFATLGQLELLPPFTGASIQSL